MRYATITVVVVFVCAGLGHAGTRAPVTGDAIIDFATTMDLPLMAVGNAGNAGELSGAGAGGFGPDRICGAADYEYRMGKFEVTTGQYTEFLNAVAASDTYGLYNANMWSHDWGCKIDQSGLDGSYTYSVAADREDRPVNYVDWGDAARFGNWLTNGMPTGAQGLSTTEDGSYFLNGAVSNVALMAVTRKAGAQYVIPSEDEWYKAAYHKNDGPTGNYFDYPTSSDAVPSNVLTDPDPGNNANFASSSAPRYTIWSPYYRTEAGEFENSESPYGTFDMTGNVREWNEAIIGSYPYRGYRGGGFYSYWVDLRASAREGFHPTRSDWMSGFRVA